MSLVLTDTVGWLLHLGAVLLRAFAVGTCPFGHNCLKERAIDVPRQWHFFSFTSTFSIVYCGSWFSFKGTIVPLKFVFFFFLNLTVAPNFLSNYFWTRSIYKTRRWREPSYGWLPFSWKCALLLGNMKSKWCLNSISFLSTSWPLLSFLILFISWFLLSSKVK